MNLRFLRASMKRLPILLILLIQLVAGIGVLLGLIGMSRSRKDKLRVE